MNRSVYRWISRARYVLIEGGYLVPESSPITANAEVDRDAHRATALQPQPWLWSLNSTMD